MPLPTAPPTFDRATAPAALRRHAAHAHRAPLVRACHARDLCLAFRARLDITLGPPFHPPPPERRVPDPRPYRDEDPHRAALELRAAAHALADRLSLLSPADWARHDPRPAAAPYTVETLTGHLLRTLARLLTEEAPPA